jgi:hypothetical protein
MVAIPYDEARELFRFIPPDLASWERYHRAAVSKIRYAAGEEVIPSDHALMLLGERDSFLARALAALPSERIEEVRHELATLTNEVVIAEAYDPGEVAEVKKCAEEVHDYINIGLAYRSRTEGRDAVRLLEETLLRPFLQVGVSLTLQLQQRAVALAKTLQQQVGEAWSGAGSPFSKLCAGASPPAPMFFRGLGYGWRDFSSALSEPR